MRYLEECVKELKTSHRSRRASLTPTSPQFELRAPQIHSGVLEDDENDDDQDEDHEMSDAVSPSHMVSTVPKSTNSFANVSPAIYPSDRSEIGRAHV